jgi:uncharacterized protein RhaS with RHS repeats
LQSQLLASDVEWDMTGNPANLANSYQYDRNGNRLEEWRDNVGKAGKINHGIRGPRGRTFIFSSPTVGLCTL